MVYDVLPGNLALNHICSYDVHYVVANVKQLDEVVKLLLNEVLNLLIEPVRYVLSEIESDELSCGGYRKEVRRNLVDAPVAFREFRNRPILPKPLPLVSYEGNVVVVELVRDISKERCRNSRVLK